MTAGESRTLQTHFTVAETNSDGQGSVLIRLVEGQSLVGTFGRAQRHHNRYDVAG